MRRATDDISNRAPGGAPDESDGGMGENGGAVATDGAAPRAAAHLAGAKSTLSVSGRAALTSALDPAPRSTAKRRSIIRPYGELQIWTSSSAAGGVLTASLPPESQQAAWHEPRRGHDAASDAKGASNFVAKRARGRRIRWSGCG